ncbi:gamma-glutamyltranspeptidase [Gluconacetobacter sacchari DSM 12717]|nr:gamma-glutamyltranspeptidase [Gluconacetobacter sacchari DSM 12717]
MRFSLLRCRWTPLVLAGSMLAGLAMPAMAVPAVQGDALTFGAAQTALPPLAPAEGAHGMVVSAQHLASEVGARILAQGGNAADAAVAVAYALAVVYPAAGNIGGGGFMTLRAPDGQTVFIDFREHAPLAATPTMYQDARGGVIPNLSIVGWKAVAVPGTVAGMDMILHRWGHMTRQQVMAPAIALARDGFVLAEGDVQLLNTSTADFARDPEARRIFLRPDGTPLRVGDRLVQADLADSLSLIARDGAAAFYRGPIADAIVQASKVGGGILQSEDFRRYAPRVLPTLTCSYRGYRVDTAPPPSGGGVALCEMLNILSGYDMHRLGLHTAPAVQREVEAMRRAYADRQDLGDPAFVRNPVTHLIDPTYAREVRATIPTDHAVPSASLKPGQVEPEKHETTQFSVADDKGMAISVTYTLNGWFGAKVIGGHTGIFLNDEMDDFSSRPGVPNMFGIVGSAANAIAPGKTPLSSMSPTILSRNGKPVMVIGSPGGSRIPTIVLSAILGVVDYGLDIQQAVDLPRIHEQWQPEPVEIEQGALTDAVAATLEREGYTLAPHAPWGVAEGILVGGPRLGARHVGTARYFGGFDRRHPGGAAVGE